jgi:hypothetical protein
MNNFKSKFYDQFSTKIQTNKKLKKNPQEVKILINWYNLDWSCGKQPYKTHQCLENSLLH